MEDALKVGRCRANELERWLTKSTSTDAVSRFFDAHYIHTSVREIKFDIPTKEKNNYGHYGLLEEFAMGCALLFTIASQDEGGKYLPALDPIAISLSHLQIAGEVLSLVSFFPSVQRLTLENVRVAEAGTTFPDMPRPTLKEIIFQRTQTTSQNLASAVSPFRSSLQSIRVRYPAGWFNKRRDLGPKRACRELLAFCGLEIDPAPSFQTLQEIEIQAGGGHNLDERWLFTTPTRGPIAGTRLWNTAYTYSLHTPLGGYTMSDLTWAAIL